MTLVLGLVLPTMVAQDFDIGTNGAGEVGVGESGLGSVMLTEGILAVCADWLDVVALLEDGANSTGPGDGVNSF